MVSSRQQLRSRLSGKGTSGTVRMRSVYARLNACQYTARSMCTDWNRNKVYRAQRMLSTACWLFRGPATDTLPMSIMLTSCNWILAMPLSITCHVMLGSNCREHHGNCSDEFGALGLTSFKSAKVASRRWAGTCCPGKLLPTFCFGSSCIRKCSVFITALLR